MRREPMLEPERVDDAHALAQREQLGHEHASDIPPPPVTRIIGNQL